MPKPCSLCNHEDGGKSPSICEVNGVPVCGNCAMHMFDDYAMPCWDVCPQHDCDNCNEIDVYHGQITAMYAA